MGPAAPHQRPLAERLEAAACLGWLGHLLALALLAVAPTGVPTTTLTELPSASAFEAQAKLIPAFLRLTARASEPMRRRIAWNGFLLSTATVLVLALFGYRLLVNLNIPLTAILASAGLVMVFVALRLVLAEYGNDGVFGQHPHGHGDGPESSLALPPPENPGLDLVVQPLVFPIILTP